MLEGIKKAIGFGPEKKALLKEEPPTPQGGLLISDLRDSILKAVQPNYLYKPPFGYPRPTNTNALRELAKNPYVFSVIKTLADEAATIEWSIVNKETNEEMDIVPNDDVKKQIIDFLENPNGNHESFAQLRRQAVVDILEVDAGVWVKVFGRDGKLKQIYARDGASFLKNTDIYGTFTNREQFVEPLPNVFVASNKDYFNTGDESIASQNMAQRYSIQYAGKAAYFQYGQAFAAWPIPFGTREIIYFSANPRADSIYGRSPLETLSEVVLTLVYGSKYNLDFYLNNNMPEGIIALEGAQQKDIEAFSSRLTQTVRDTTDSLGFKRRMGYRVGVTGFSPKFEKFQLSPVDMQVLDQQKWFDRVMLRSFGMNEHEMGTTDNSNKATSDTQSEVFKRKALKPILDIIAYGVNTQILTEFEGSEGLEFRFDDYDLDDDIKKHTLYESQIRMGIKTPEMIAVEEGIDVDELKAQKEEALQKQQDMMMAEKPQNGENGGFPPKKKEDVGDQIDEEKEKPKEKVEKKAKTNPEMDEITSYIRDIGNELVSALDELPEE